MIGVLALQGAFIEHINILKKLNVEAKEVRTVEDFNVVDALIIPGGESTVMIKLLKQTGLDDAIKEAAQHDMPIYGTCAGAIVLANETDKEITPLQLIDITVKRNAYGSQQDSFEAEVTFNGNLHTIFIRAPMIESIGKEVVSLAEHNGKTILARQNNILVSTFHPELTNDTRVHQYFLEMLRPIITVR